MTGRSFLRECRVRALLSRSRLAELADVSRDTVARAEDGETILDVQQEKITRALLAELVRLEVDPGFDDRFDLFPDPEEATA